MSLVPSLTETCFDLGVCAERFAGRTAWCIHPEAEVARIPKVGGTKTPSLARILALEPDLVLLDEEENTRACYDTLVAAGIPVFVSRVRRVADIPELLERLGARLGHLEAGQARAQEVSRGLARLHAAVASRRKPRAVPLIWREPLMAVAPTRYAGDIVRQAGFEVHDFAQRGEGYPVVRAAELAAARIEHLLLTSEPHPFTAAEGEEIAAAIEAAGGRRPRVHLVDGEALTWFGGRTATALEYWREVRLALEDDSDRE